MPIIEQKSSIALNPTIISGFSSISATGDLKLGFSSTIHTFSNLSKAILSAHHSGSVTINANSQITIAFISPLPHPTIIASANIHTSSSITKANGRVKFSSSAVIITSSFFGPWTLPELHEHIQTVSTISANLSGITLGSATLAGSSIVNRALIQSAPESNRFGSATLIGSTILTPKAGIITYNIGRISTTSKLKINYTIYQAEIGEFALIIDLYIPQAINALQNRFKEQLTIDGSVVPIKNWTIEQNEHEIAPTLKVELARIEDGFNITPTSTILFQTAKYVSGSWENWVTKVSTNRIGSTEYTIARDNQGPADKFILTAVPFFQQKVNTWARQPIVFFDPYKVKISSSDIENLTDQNGNNVPTVFIPVIGLTWKIVTTYLFCIFGPFGAIQSDIPDWQIERIDVGIGDNVKDIIGGEIAMFKPDFYEITPNTIVIRSTIFHNPTGFPRTLEIPVSEVISTGASYTDRLDSDIAGYKISYTSTKNNHDPENVTYTTSEHNEFVTEKSKDPEEADAFLNTHVLTTFAEYRTKLRPDTIIRSEVVDILRETTLDWVQVEFDDAGTENRINRHDVIQSSEEAFTFDNAGRQFSRFKSTSALIPFAADEDATEWLLTFVPVSDEWEFFEWRAHPFNKEKIFLAYRRMTEEGLIFVDEENTQVTGENFAQSALKAYRNGNISEGQKSYYGQIKAMFLSGEPVDREIIRQRTTTIDCIAGSIITDDEDVQAGDIGISAIGGTTQKPFLIVKPGAVTGRIETLSTGNMPLNMAIELALILLKQDGEESKYDASLVCVGLRDEVQINIGITPLGRGGEELGDYQVKGWTQSGGQGEPYLTTIKGKFGH